MRLIVLAALAAPSLASANTPAPADSGGGALALVVLIAAIAGWIGLRQLIRGMRARKTQSTVGESFATYALEVLVNAAKIDGRINDAERTAIARHKAWLATRQARRERDRDPGRDPDD